MAPLSPEQAKRLRAALEENGWLQAAVRQVIELLLKFGAASGDQNNDRHHLLDAVLANCKTAPQPLSCCCASVPVPAIVLSQKFLANGSEDSKLRIYDLENLSLVKELGEATSWVASIFHRVLEETQL